MDVTIHDVAARAGVSAATASRALSGQRGVRDENRQRVRTAAHELGYEPNVMAASLRSRTTHTMGMLVPRISNPFFATLVETVEQQLHQSRRSLLLGNSHYDPEVEERQLRALLDRRVDALIMIPCHRERGLAAVETASSRVPTVQLDLRVDGHHGSWVGVDNTCGTGLIVEHLSALGARRLAFVGAEPTDSSAQDRLDGYRRMTRRLPGSADSVLLGDYTREWGRRAAQRLLDDAVLPDGIVCGNDTIALGVLESLAGNGVRVPDDVRVTGFDDIPFADVARPSLTTVRQPQEQMAEEAIRVLSEGLAGDDHRPRSIAITPELVVRASSGPVPPSPRAIHDR